MAKKSVAKRMKDGVRSLTRAAKKTAKKATRAVARDGRPSGRNPSADGLKHGPVLPQKRRCASNRRAERQHQAASIGRRLGAKCEPPSSAGTSRCAAYIRLNSSQS